MPVQRMWRVLLPVIAISVCLACSPAFAQGQHIRGTLNATAEHAVTVETSAGASVTVATTDKTGYFVVDKSRLSDVKPGEFVGVTSISRNGKQVAEEIHVFAESLRGLGEGHYPWDRDQEANMMTNATIARVDSVSGSNEIKLDYKGGEQTLSVPLSVPVVTFDKGSRADLKPGRHVFILMSKDEANKAAAAVVVGVDGVIPTGINIDSRG